MSVWICKLILTFSFSRIILFAWILWKLNTAYEIEARPWGSSLQENKVQWEVASLKPWKDECFWVINEMENDQHSILGSRLLYPSSMWNMLLTFASRVKRAWKSGGFRRHAGWANYLLSPPLWGATRQHSHSHVSQDISANPWNYLLLMQFIYFCSLKSQPADFSRSPTKLNSGWHLQHFSWELLCTWCPMKILE